MNFSRLLGLLIPFPSVALCLVSGSLNWTTCASSKNLECATLSVPIDWSSPNGEHISMFVTKLPASDQATKIGSLIVNPGGPGVSGEELLLSAAASTSPFPPQFDIIGPDPRGVGKSHPLKCEPSIWNQVVSYQPKDEASFQQLVTHNKALGESCRNLTGPLLGYMDSYSVARDFEALRIALGDENLTYSGLSYGTVFGQAYAELFPDTIRAMALDGNLDHSLSDTESLADEVASYENELVRFSAWCQATPSCALHGQDVLDVFANLTARVNETTSWNIRHGFQKMIVFKSQISIPDSGWHYAATNLKEAAAGNLTAFSPSIAESRNSQVIWGNGIATLCLDWNHTATTLSDLKYKEQMTKDLAPYTQGASAQFYLQSACIGWPEPVRYVPHTIDVKGTPPILLTNAYHDPETPYVEANGLLGQIENAVLATRKGDGHTSWLLFGETYEAINNYLANLTVPKPNTVFDS